MVLREPKPVIEAKKELRLFLKDKLDAYKIPTRVRIVDRTNFNERFKKIRRKDAPIRQSPQRG